MTTTHETSTVVQAHACVIEGITYRFGVRRVAAEELAASLGFSFACLGSSRAQASEEQVII